MKVSRRSELPWLCAAFVVLLLTGVGALAYSADQDEKSAYNQCMASGKGWTVVGSHVQLTPVVVGKVIVLQSRVANDYGCVEVRR